MAVIQKECFGVLDRVFPMGEEGLRETVSHCFDCPQRVECLRTALATKEGVAFRSEILDRTPAVGIFGRLRRWSERKHLSRLMKESRGKGV